MQSSETVTEVAPELPSFCVYTEWMVHVVPSKNIQSLSGSCILGSEEKTYMEVDPKYSDTLQL